jgi:hypothetical protein
MFLFNAARGFSEWDLETWLHDVLIPVEPDERFIRKLKARLIHVRGGRLWTIWTTLGAAAMLFLALLGWMAFMLRILLLIFALFGLFGERERRSSGSL